MIKLAHISDLHFGREQPNVIEAMLQRLNEQQPDFVIISGDVTQRAKHSEFEQVRAFLQALPFPYLIVPGNHDISASHLIERFCYPWRKWRSYISDDLEPSYSQQEFSVVGLNSARRFGFYFDWSRGRINPQQVQDAIFELSNAGPDTLKIVVAHHPFWLPRACLKRQLIGGRDEALNSFSLAGVDLILGGHIHLPFINIVDGVLVSHAGTSVSNRLLKGQPNSFNIITGDAKRLEISLWEWEGNHFHLRQSLSFEKQSKGWQSSDERSVASNYTG